MAKTTLEKVTLAVLEDAEGGLSGKALNRAVARRMARRSPGWRGTSGEVDSALSRLRRLGDVKKDGTEWRRT